MTNETLAELARQMDSGRDVTDERCRAFGHLRWLPLEQAVGAENARMFMFMGMGRTDTPFAPIMLYKHVNSRRYLNIDTAGEFFRCSGFREYQPISREQAMEGVFASRPC